jgi:spore germination cell wall hydrolase CwlJ-like protein
VKRALSAMALCGVLIVAAQARGGSERASKPEPAGNPDWSAWTRPLAPGDAPQPVPAGVTAAAAPQPAESAREEIDVVDAHWMALTMWGEGRGEGEEGMRAIGHVIHNRWRAKRHGSFVTDTVSQAWQFSAWNQADPNRAAMLNIDGLRPGSRDHRLWLDAKGIAAEILAGGSADPTGGALFYHTADVQPAWSRGVVPAAQVGGHLFFRASR